MASGHTCKSDFWRHRQLICVTVSQNPLHRGRNAVGEDEIIRSFDEQVMGNYAGEN
jgi:hypothetical protein